MPFFLYQPKADKPTAINLIHSIKGDRPFKYSTRRSIHPNDWDFDNGMPKRTKGRAGVQLNIISNDLSEMQEFLDSIILDAEMNGVQITKVYLRDRFDQKYKGTVRKQVHTIVNVIENFMEAKNASGGMSKDWNEKYNNLKTKIGDFGSHRTTDIGDDWLLRYCGFLRENFNYNDNTLSRHIDFFLTVLRWAKAKYFFADIPKNPIRPYEPENVYLTEEELDKLWNANIRSDALARIRDVFLLGCYTGQRYSDYSVFECEDYHNGMIVKKAEKVERESFIPLNDRSLEILERYDWELPKISDDKFNDGIRSVCMRAGISDSVKKTRYKGNEKLVEYFEKWELVSSHTARRTFVTLSAEKGLPDHIIMKITGIRNYDTLKKYKRTSQQSVRDYYEKVWGNNL